MSDRRVSVFTWLLLGDKNAGRNRHIDPEADCGLSGPPVVERLGECTGNGAVRNGENVVFARLEKSALGRLKSVDSAAVIG